MQHTICSKCIPMQYLFTIAKNGVSLHALSLWILNQVKGFIGMWKSCITVWCKSMLQILCER